MLRMLLRFILLTAVAAAATWLAYRPGNLTLEWLGRHIELPLALALAGVAVGFIVIALVWSLLRRLLHTPGAVTDYFRFRRTRRGQEALSAGMIAISAGDIAGARRQAQIAARILPDEPLARLLAAETARLEGNARQVKAIYGDMLAHPETELVALRGLFEDARRNGDMAAARRYAQRALRRNAGAAWASAAMLAIQSAEADWPAVSATIEAQRKARLLDDNVARRNRAVVLTAQALAAEDAEPDAAVDLATRAHKLDAALVPAAVVAGRLNVRDGALRRAAKILEKTWALSPHPDLAAVYTHARPGDSPLDRLKRMRDLLKVAPGGEEGAVALAGAAIDARDWKLARQALSHHIAERPRARVCALMAEIEEGEFGDKGRAREWLARAVRAPRDPLWIADGVTSRTWLPVSPVSGALGAFRWAAPPEALGPPCEADAVEAAGDDDAPLLASDEAGSAPEAAPVAIAPPPPAAEGANDDDDEIAAVGKAAGPANAVEKAVLPWPGPGPGKAEAPASQVSGQVSRQVSGQVSDEAASTDSEAIALSHQPDDPGPDPQTGKARRAGWLGGLGEP